MSDQAKGPMTDEEIYMLASEHEYEHGTDMFGFARALLAEAGERVVDEIHDYYDRTSTMSAAEVSVTKIVKHILGVKHE